MSSSFFPFFLWFWVKPCWRLIAHHSPKKTKSNQNKTKQRKPTTTSSPSNPSSKLPKIFLFFFFFLASVTSPDFHYYSRIRFCFLPQKPQAHAMGDSACLVHPFSYTSAISTEPTQVINLILTSYSHNSLTHNLLLQILNFKVQTHSVIHLSSLCFMLGV